MGRSKIIYGDEVLIDITDSTVDEDHLLKGVKAYDKAGEPVIGKCEFDSDTSDATAVAGEILLGKTAYVAGNKIEGEMPNRGAIDEKIKLVDDIVTVPNGYHDGSGTVTLDDTEKAKLKAENIKAGIEILGVEGTYGGEEIKVQRKTATPYTDKVQSIIPDEGFDYLSQVDIEKIAYAETPNPAGGITVIIGTKSPA